MYLVYNGIKQAYETVLPLELIGKLCVVHTLGDEVYCSTVIETLKGGENKDNLHLLDLGDVVSCPASLSAVLPLLSNSVSKEYKGTRLLDVAEALWADSQTQDRQAYEDGIFEMTTFQMVWDNTGSTITTLPTYLIDPVTIDIIGDNVVRVTFDEIGRSWVFNGAPEEFKVTNCRSANIPAYLPLSELSFAPTTMIQTVLKVLSAG